MNSKYFNIYENKKDGRRIYYGYSHLCNAERSAIRFRRKVMNACRFVSFKVFGTLTYADEFLPYSSKHVSKFFQNWRKHNTRLKIPKDKVEYIWREDFGKKNGRPHYHFLVNDFVDLEKARVWWGKGFIWLRRVYTINEVRRYLYKYMCKPNELEEQFINNRRYGCSRDIPKVPKSEWKLVGIANKKSLLDCVYVHNRKIGVLDAYLQPKKNKV